jgi:hypothetical protein
VSSKNLSFIKDGLREVHIENSISLYNQVLYHTKKHPFRSLAYVFFKLNQEIDKDFFEMSHYQGFHNMSGRSWSIHGVDIDLFLNLETDIISLKLTKNSCSFREDRSLRKFSYEEVIETFMPYYLLKIRSLWLTFSHSDPSQ